MASRIGWFNLALRATYFRARFFFTVAATGGNSASAQAVITCLTFFASLRFTAAVACAVADPAILFAPLRNMLINGFFIGVFR